MGPESAFSSIKKNVEAVSFNPKAKAQIIGCLPLFKGNAAGWKPTTPILGIFNNFVFSKLDHPKQKIISGFRFSIQFNDSSEFKLELNSTGIPCKFAIIER